MPRRNWTEEETILALDLYLRIPNGKISHTHPEVIKLSKMIDRTPDAVALKMHNLSHFDPELIARNLSGMSNTSKLDEEIFNRYLENPSAVFEIADKIYENNHEEHFFNNEEINLPAGYSTEQIVKARKGHKAFADIVKASYKDSCCITGINCKSMLVASHIKPWRDSDEHEKTDPRNGLCLNVFHDKAFDRGLITVKPDFSIVVSSKLIEASMDENTKAWLLSYNGKKITLPEKYLPSTDYLQYHNDMVFEKVE